MKKEKVNSEEQVQTDENATANTQKDDPKFTIPINKFSFLKAVFLVLLISKVGFLADLSWGEVFLPYILDWSYTIITFVVWVWQEGRKLYNKTYLS